MEKSLYNEKEKLSKSIQRNIGIEILRMILCFRIVLLHYYRSKNKFILKLRENLFQVPCFFLISFYYLYSTISKKDVQKMKLRIEKLSIPYILYPIIVWSINNLMFLLIKYNRFGRLLSLKELKTHIIIGRGISGICVLWFLFNMIILTLFFFILSFLLKKQFFFYIRIIALISYLIQYSGINNSFFNQYTIKISISVGNLVETFPLAFVGFYLSSSNFYQKLLNNRMTYILYSSFFFYLISEYNIFSKLKGQASPGLKSLIVPILLFNIFYLIPFERIYPKILIIINYITRYTKGIYCMHYCIQNYVRKYLDPKATLIGCVILYIISYLISLFGFQIFQKTKIKYLFI